MKLVTFCNNHANSLQIVTLKLKNQLCQAESDTGAALEMCVLDKVIVHVEIIENYTSSTQHMAFTRSQS